MLNDWLILFDLICRIATNCYLTCILVLRSLCVCQWWLQLFIAVYETGSWWEHTFRPKGKKGLWFYLARYVVNRIWYVWYRFRVIIFILESGTISLNYCFCKGCIYLSSYQWNFLHSFKRGGGIIMFCMLFSWWIMEMFLHSNSYSTFISHSELNG